MKGKANFGVIVPAWANHIAFGTLPLSTRTTFEYFRIACHLPGSLRDKPAFLGRTQCDDQD